MSDSTSRRSRPDILGFPLRWMMTALVVAVALICGAVFKLLLDARDGDRARASTEIANLSEAVTRDIARNLDLYDLSIQGVLEGLGNPAVMASPKPLRQLILFDRAASAPFLGALLVLDEHGDVIIDSSSVTPRALNYADRDYFKIHAEHPDQGLYVSRPMQSKTDGRLVVGLSRRVNKPDGSFGGIVLGTLRVDYFHQLFERLNLGARGSLTLFRTDGAMVMREPYDPNLIGKQFGPVVLMQHLAKAREGEFEAQSVIDGVTRLFHYQQVGDYPLVQNVALSVDDVDADWRAKAVWASAVMGVCCGTIILLGLALRRELDKRAEAEAALTTLAEEDRLTGLANRRRFDGALAAEWRRVARLGGSLSLLMVDADLFKSYNDSLGHLAGDAALATLGHCLGRWAQRPGDVAARYGGEEFALILPHTTAVDAMRLAEVIRHDVLNLKIDHPASPWRRLSVSIGVASVRPHLGRSPTLLVAEADMALYTSKAEGRNRTTLHTPTAWSAESGTVAYEARAAAE